MAYRQRIEPDRATNVWARGALAARAVGFVGSYLCGFVRSRVILPRAPAPPRAVALSIVSPNRATAGPRTPRLPVPRRRGRAGAGRTSVKLPHAYGRGKRPDRAAYVDSRYAAREPCSCGTKVAFFKVTTTTYANIRELVRPASGQPALPGRGAISLLRDRWLRHHEILLHAWRTRRGFCPVLAESKAIDTLYSPQTTKLLGTSSGGMWNS